MPLVINMIYKYNLIWIILITFMNNTIASANQSAQAFINGAASMVGWMHR